VIPADVSDLDRLISRVTQQTDQLSALCESVPVPDWGWRADATRWSMTGHLAHLVIINEGYLGSISEVMRRAGVAGGPMSAGPYRHPPLAKWLVRSQEPPPKTRMKTFRSMVPDSEASRDQAWADFRRLQITLVEQIEGARGFDVGRIRFGSPFLRILRLSVGTGFGLIVAHNSRHIWLVNEVNRARVGG
jgi:hypothetical protein